MKITTVVPILNQKEVSQKFLDLYNQTSEIRTPLLVIDNGSMPPVRDWLIGLKEGDLVVRNGENEGVLRSLNQAWEVLKNSTDYIFYTHNDVLLHEQGWDKKIIQVLEEENKKDKKVGAAGFYGAKGIGTWDIYKSPYRMHQLVRLENVSGCHRMNASIHGFRPLRFNQNAEDIAVLDGFSLIIRTELLNKLNGFDRNYPPHHNYDNDICLESLDKGYRNIVIRMDAEHLGGRTDVGENWAERFGKTKAQIHEEAHPVMYEKWRPGKHSISFPVRIA